METCLKSLLLVCSVGLSLGACKTSTSQGPTIEHCRQAYQRGDVLEAYTVLKSLDLENQPKPADYHLLIDDVTEAVEYLIEQWLHSGDQLLAEGDLRGALRYYRDISQRLKDDDPLGLKAAEKAGQVEAQIASVERQIEQTAQAASTAFLAGDYEEARLKLLQVREQVREHGLDYNLDSERLLAECDRRLPSQEIELSQPAAPGEIAPEVAETAPVRRSRLRHPPRRRRVRPDVKPAETKPSEVDALFTRAGRLQARGDILGAVTTLRKILAIQPSHSGAKAAMRALKPEREALVARWMKKASEHFAREELDKAAPFWRKVLKIDPDNLRAKEGLQMFRHLEEIKSKQEQSGGSD
ncbi:MAG: hypothetical protein JXR96_23655 [Deltaproteobacteria bacterium]|nr:hypothetical protein [Deltaproteobacteria bacterium]